MIDVAEVKSDGLPDPHPGRGQQPEQRVVGQAARFGCESTRRSQESGDVGVGVEEGRRPLMTKRDQAGRRDLGRRIDPGQVAGEPAGGRHPPRRHRDTADQRRLLAPLQRCFDRDGRQFVLFQECDEGGQQPRRVRHLMSEALTQRQVVAERLPERTHRLAPGQGSVMLRSVFRSTFA